MQGTKKLAILALIVSSFISHSFSQGALAADYKEGEIIVKLKKTPLINRSALNALYAANGVQSVKRFRGMMKGFEQYTLAEGVNVQETVAALNTSPLVEYAQPNYILRVMPDRMAQFREYLADKVPVELRSAVLNHHNSDSPIPGLPPGLPCIPGFDIPDCDPNAQLPCLFPGIPFPPGCDDSGLPGAPGNPGTPSKRPDLEPAPAEPTEPVNDPDLGKAYGISKIFADQVWSDHKGSKEFVVAVIDTGIDYNHEDLGLNVWRNPNPTQNDVAGFDFVHNDGLPFDDNDHGTHCSGTIGAVGFNGKGVSGVNQRISVMGLKFLSGSGSGTSADAIRAIDYAVQNGAKVLSNSWGGPSDENNRALYDAIERAKEKDVLFIAAAGNDGANNDGANPSYPAAFDNDNLISVAATDKADKMAFFSNYGKKTTHVAAPGVDVYSTVPGNKYASHSGTSMACPHVAGAAALVWSKHPEWNYKQVKEALFSTVDKLPSLDKKISTGGRINVQKAIGYKF